MSFRAHGRRELPRCEMSPVQWNLQFQCSSRRQYLIHNWLANKWINKKGTSHPIKICQSVPSPFFEGAVKLQNLPNIAPVCQQKFTGRRTAAWNELHVALEINALCCPCFSSLLRLCFSSLHPTLTDTHLHSFISKQKCLLHLSLCSCLHRHHLGSSYH